MLIIQGRRRVFDAVGRRGIEAGLNLVTESHLLEMSLGCFDYRKGSFAGVFFVALLSKHQMRFC